MYPLRLIRTKLLFNLLKLFWYNFLLVSFPFCYVKVTQEKQLPGERVHLALSPRSVKVNSKPPVTVHPQSRAEREQVCACLYTDHSPPPEFRILCLADGIAHSGWIFLPQLAHGHGNF